MRIKQFTISENISHESLVGAKGKFIMSNAGFTLETDEETDVKEILAFARAKLNEVQTELKKQIIASYNDNPTEVSKPVMPTKSPYKKREWV